MNQDQQPRRWWKRIDTWVVLALILLGLTVAAITTVGYWLRFPWTGMQTKSAWDWLDLLIIPIVLGAGAFLFNNQTRKSEQAIAQDRTREEALQQFLGTMQELILDKGLRKSEKHAEIRNVARARTLTVLRSLDGNRKGQVVRFLHEADLIGNFRGEQAIEAIIDLRDANLSCVKLRDVVSVDLKGANLSYVCLSNANLIEADLSNANLIKANLSGANLIKAKGQTKEQLAQAQCLVGATLPDGTVIRTKEDWEEFKKRYRQSSQAEEVPKQWQI